MNRTYQQAEIEVVVLDADDVIVTSGDQGGIDQGDVEL